MTFPENDPNFFDESPEVPTFIEKSTNYKRGHEQWLIDGVKFIPTTKTIPLLPRGFYTIHYNNKIGSHYLRKRNIVSEDLLHLPDDNFNKILLDIKKFWASVKGYDNYDFVYKRGILLFGPGGCGKTSLIQLIAKDLMDNHNGIIISISSEDDLYAFDELMASLREIEPDRKIILIFEDIDNLIAEDYNDNATTKLLGILDGDGRVHNVVNIATTNKPEMLKDRIVNRPSRFDRRYQIGKPNATVREYYIKKKLKAADLKKINLADWIEKTDGFTIDHLKEILLSVFILGYSFDEAVQEMKNLMNRSNLKMEEISTRNKPGFEK